MNKLKLTSLVGAAALLATSISTNSFAGSIGVGLNATGAYVNTTGQETLKQSGVVTKAERHAVGLLPSGYIQYVLDNGVTFGWDMSPGKVSIGSKGATKEEAGDNYTSAQRTVRNEAKAKARDLHVVYVESPAWEAGGGLFVKGGVASVTIESNEDLETGSVYPNEDVYGYQIGIGFKGTADSGIHMKFQAEYTDFDTVSLNSTADADGGINKITADPEIYGLKVSVGYQF